MTIKINYILIALFSILILGLGACKTKSLSVRVLKPAEIYIPGKINTLAVVNRSLPTKGDGSRIINVLEGLLSGEGLFVDRYASDKCIKGLTNGLSNSPRFSIVPLERIDSVRGTGTSKFPEPLQWKIVEEICNNYSVDGLISLETFDSNTSKDFTSKQKKENIEGKEITYEEIFVSVNIAVNTGWRIYYPSEHLIVDQSIFTDYMSSDAKGRTKKSAVKNLPKASDAIEDAGYFAGKQYAKRISPTWIWVSRKYYIKGNNDFKDAKYKVQSKQWEDAAQIWQKYVNDLDPKIAGYACYNMALASEVLGKFDIALDWAKRAYSEYHLKSAFNYIYIIEDRIKEAEILKKQMNNN